MEAVVTAGLIFGLGILVLAAFFAWLATKSTADKRGLMAAVMILVGFATGGGLASVYAGSAASSAADQAASDVKGQVETQVQTLEKK